MNKQMKDTSKIFFNFFLFLLPSLPTGKMDVVLLGTLLRVKIWLSKWFDNRNIITFFEGVVGTYKEVN